MRTKKSRINSYLVAASCTSLLLAACNKSSKTSGGDSSPPVALEASALDRLDPKNQNVHHITAKLAMAVAGASLKCLLVTDGVAGEWRDCPTDGEQVVAAAGRSYQYKVKAVTATAESREYSLSFAGVGTVAPKEEESALQTLILNKDAIGTVYNQTELHVRLGVDADPAVAADMRFECKREHEEAFRLCTTKDGYDFETLVHDKSYSLTVRAVDRATNIAAKPDSVSFRVQLAAAGLEITGAEALENKRGNAELNFSLNGAARYSCSLDQAPMSDCSDGLRLQLDRLQTGQHTLRVEALDQNGGVLDSEQLSFCAQICPGVGGGQVQVLEPVFLLGAHYQATVPQGMHVQQYSSNINFNGALNFYRIAPSSDPYAIGNDACNGEWDVRTSALAPRGQAFDYCNSTNNHMIQNWKLERRFADNHLQIATDPDLIDADPRSQEVILFNMFTQAQESLHTESRFATLCQYGLDGFQGLNAIRRSNVPLAMANGFFDIDWRFSDLWTCDVMLAGAWGEPQLWKIGAFYMGGRNQPFPDYTCNCDYVGSRNLLEVVYMTRDSQPDALFAASAQQLFLNTTKLRSVRP